MRNLIQRALNRQDPAPTRSWERPINTAALRHAAVDMAIINLQIATRREAEHAPEQGAEQDTLVGDYLEFGVYRGGTFLHVHHRARALMPWMRFFAFDSFEGLPATEGIDASGEFEQGQFACSRPQFEANLRDADAEMARIQIVEGWFDKTLTEELRAKHDMKVASIAYIDCDLYASTVPVLQFITPLVRQGSIIMFDDWYCFRADQNKGVQLATTQWLEQNPQLSLVPWHPFCHHGQSFIVQVS